MLRPMPDDNGAGYANAEPSVKITGPTTPATDFRLVSGNVVPTNAARDWCEALFVNAP